MSEAGIFVAVGSNIDPESNILRGLQTLGLYVEITGVSTFYETEPVGPPGQPSFVNGAVRIESELPPRELKFGLLRKVEELLDRRRGADKYAPRTLDLDLVLYKDVVVDEVELILPDPQLALRPFVALPVAELGGLLPGPTPSSGRPMRPLFGLTRKLREMILS